MGADLLTFLSAGFQQSLLPVQLVNAGIFALGFFFLRRARPGARRGFVFNFLITLFLAGAFVDLRGIDIARVHPVLFDVAMWIYIGIAAVFIVAGILFFMEWRELLLERGAGLAGFIPRPEVWRTIAQAAAVVIALLLVFLATTWPSNYPVLVQGLISRAPGMLFHSLGLILVYEVARNIPAVLLALLFFLGVRNRAGSFLRDRRSLVAILMSAAYLAVGGMVIFLYVTGTRSMLQFV